MLTWDTKSVGTSPMRNAQGFTLIEMIVYVAILSVFFWVVLGFFMQMQAARTKSAISREIKENASQVLETLKTHVRVAASTDIGVSHFDVDPGALGLANIDGTEVFDTYTKTVLVGGVSKLIRTLRLSRPSLPAEDLTSEHVSVTSFQVSNSGIPSNFYIRLGLSSVNPGVDPLYDSTLDLHTSVTIRNEG